MKKLFTRRYVQDYRLENVSDSYGRIRTVPVYRGEWFRFTDGTPQDRRREILALTLIASAAEIPLLAVNSSLMRTWYASAPILLGLIPLVFLWSVAARLCTVKREFRREDRDRFENRYPVSTLLFALLNSIAVITGVCASVQNPGELLLCACPAVCALCGWRMFARRKRLKCVSAPKENGL